MPIFEIETDQGIFEIDADREPTQAEALEAIAGQPALRPAQQRAFQAEQALTRNAALPLIQEGDYSGAIPFHGYQEAAAQGYKTGQEAFGEGALGKSIGALFGAAMAAGTALNPLAVGAQGVAKLAQAGGEVLGGQEGQALQSMTGERAVLPELQPSAYNTGSQNLNTALNFISELATQARKDPVSAAMILEGIRSPQAAQAVKTLPGAIVEGAVAPIKATRGAVSRLATTTDDLLAFTTGAEKTPQVFKARLEEGAFNEVLPDLARAKKSGGVEGVNKAREALNKETFDVIDPIVKAIDPQSPLLNQESILQKADAKLALDIDTPEVRTSSLNTSKKYITDLTPDNLLARYKDVSDQLITFWKSPDQAKFANRIKGLEAIRETLSEVIKTSLDERGVEPSIWSKHGKTNELVDQFVKNYGTENVLYKSKRGEGIFGKKGVEAGDVVSKLPLAGTLIRGASNVMERATGGSPRLINKRVDQLFKEVKPSVPTITQAELGDLLKQVTDEAQANRAATAQRQAQAAEMERYGATPEEINAYLNEEAQGKTLAGLSEDISAQFPIAAEQLAPAINLEKMGATTSDLNTYMNREAALIKQIKNKQLAEAIKETVEQNILSSGKLNEVRAKAEALGFFD